MKNQACIFLMCSYIAFSVLGCKTKETAQTITQETSVVMAVQPTVIYKTTRNYDKNVAVTLSDDKQRIVSYPHPSDVSQRSYPTPLNKSYLLDNRGISKNTAFLSITYEEYAKLRNAPSLDELKQLIIDDNPIEEMYNCGGRTRFSDLIPQLNQLIDQNFKDCQRIK
jgi:hypothetical protein